MSKTRECNECGKEYSYKLETSKFCSGTCRANAANKRKGLGDTDLPTSAPAKFIESKSPKRTEITMPDGIGPQAQYIIGQATKEADRWEKYSDELKADLKEKTKEAEKLREELNNLKNEQRIAEATGPSGLGGLMESPGFSKFLEYAGPGISKISEKLGDWITSPGKGVPQIAGPDTDNPGLNEFIQWLTALDENTRLQVWQLISYLSTLNQNDLSITLSQLQSMGMLGKMWATG